MSYNSKYTGAQVEELLDQIANGEVDNVYVTDFTIYDLLDVLDTGVSKSVDAVSLFAAIEANKIIIVPQNDSNPLGGYVADTTANESCYNLYVNYSNTYIELALSQHSSTEITPLDVYKVDMQEMLISGETIKTINGEEILGGGNIELATKEELNDKVDKVSGKQLSTEDFTSALKAKLEGLSNYDDTTLSNAISGLETRLNTLVSGDASTAIESFNEIMAFLDGIKDTQDLASIIASIEQQIAGKYTKPSGGIPASDLAPDVFLQGEKGEKGDKGDTGATGPQGVSVTSVVQTTTSSADGGSNVVTVTLSDGKTSTFTVKNGSKGSQGEKGDKGDTGAEGPQGVQGIQGPKGDTGADGAQGPKGDQGEQGPKGDKGDKGDTGAAGTNGTNGVSVSSVKQTTTSTSDGGTNVVTVTLSNGTTSTFNVKNGSKGSNGTNGTNGTNGATFTPSVDSAGNLSWTNDKGLSNPPTVNIKGPKGDSGEGGGSGEDIRYFTEFTVEDFIEGCEDYDVISEDATELHNAMKSNKIICVPYKLHDKGFHVASYKANDAGSAYIYLQKGGIEYVAWIGVNYELGGNPPKYENVRVVEMAGGDVVFECYDNHIYIITDPVDYLLPILDIIQKGTTIQFMSGANGTTLEFMSAPFWANGEVPTIEPSTRYELSLVNIEGPNVVLTPFKSVE